jgi:hypothetical protein
MRATTASTAGPAPTRCTAARRRPVVFASAAASPAATPDLIADLAADDLIDLHFIHADSGTGGNEAFAFPGAQPFSGPAGELHFDPGLLAGDIDGDALADFAVQISGATVTQDNLLL